jgi:hypothetical protein
MQHATLKVMFRVLNRMKNVDMEKGNGKEKYVTITL